MKTEVLLRSIGKINDELIADAESEANTKRKPGWAKLGIMAACLALVLCTGIATHAIRSNATAGTFTMDVNPSVEYTIAKSGSVKNVRCLNSDAENALSDVALGKQSVETALTRTVAAYEACGYMENGEATVLISFDSRLDANAELKASLSAEIQQTLEQTDAVGTLVFHSELTENAEAAKIAEEFHVSLGRADWILTAANKTGLPTDEVARMSLDELLKFQEASGIASVSVSKFISLEEAKKIALRDAKLDELTQKIVFTREELNRNQGKPCYLLEFYTGTNQYFYQIDAKSGSIIYAGKFITLSEAKKIALDDAGCEDKVSFTEETLVSGGIKTPYYRFVFADAKTQWTYRIDAVLGTVLEKQQKEIVTTDFISLEEAKQIALKDAGLDEAAQKIVFTREELNRNSDKPCYILEFYTAKKQYSYKVDAKNGSIMEAYHFILLADAKKIALDDAGVSEKVTFTEETLVAGGIKSPYYSFAFESDTARWTYKIDAVLGSIMDKTYDKIVSPAPEFIGLEKAKQIALKDAGLSASQVSFVRAGLDWDNGRMEYEVEFWKDNVEYDFSQGACVAGEDTAAFLEDALSQLGLTRREANERMLQRARAVGRGFEVEGVLDDWMSMLRPRRRMQTLVAQLKQRGYCVYYLSNIPEDVLDLLMHRDFEGLFDGGVASCEVKINKPDPRIYQALLDKYHLRADECIFIDDRADNLVAASALGFGIYEMHNVGTLLRSLPTFGVSLH